MFRVNICTQLMSHNSQLKVSFLCIYVAYKCAMIINKKLNIQLGLMGELCLAGIVVLDGKSSDQAAFVTSWS